MDVESTVGEIAGLHVDLGCRSDPDSRLCAAVQAACAPDCIPDGGASNATGRVPNGGAGNAIDRISDGDGDNATDRVSGGVGP